MGDMPELVMIDSLTGSARARVTQWMRTTGVTQKVLAKRIGKQQAWLSRYLAGKYDADVLTLERLAEAFGHTVSALLVQPAGDPTEARVLDLYRALTPRGRRTVLQLLEDLARPMRGAGATAPPAPPRTTRA